MVPSPWVPETRCPLSGNVAISNLDLLGPAAKVGAAVSGYLNRAPACLNGSTPRGPSLTPRLHSGYNVAGHGYCGEDGTMKSRRLLGAIFVLLALTGCDKKEAAKAEGTKEGEGASTKQQAEEFVAGTKADMFTLALAADPETFDTAKMSGAPEGRIAFNVFEGLMMPNVTTEGLDDPSKLVVPGVAESYEMSEDGKTYTFKLRKDAKWSNGEPVTAKDFEWSWKRVLTPGFPADYAQMLWVIEGAEAYNKGENKDWASVGVKATDDQTLQVVLTSPTPYFLELLAFYTFFPTPQKVVEEKGDDWTRPENIVSNGPYRLASYKPQQEIVLETNEHYWDKAALKIPKAKLRIIPDATARVTAYKTGELHWSGAGLPVAQITSLLTHPDYYREPLLGTYYYRINVKNDGALQNPKVREALALAIDRSSLVNNTLNGLYESAESFVPPMAGYKSVTKTDYNIKKAKDALAEAGFPGGKGFPKVSLLYNTDENHKLVAESVQDMWKRNLGIDVALNNKEWKTYLQDVDTLSYEIARAGWIGDFNDPMTFLDMWVTDNGNNDTGWSNEQYDKLIADAQKEVDPKKRAELLQQAEKLLLEQGPVIAIYYYATNGLRSSKLKGFEPHNRDVHLLKYMSLAE